MRFKIRHETQYVFPETVQFHAHRLMVRPRDSHDLRLHTASLTLSPPAPVRWSYDVFGNSIGTVAYNDFGTELSIVSEMDIERYPLAPTTYDISGAAKAYPPRYPAEERRDLGDLLYLSDEDSAAAIEAWIDKWDLRFGPNPLEVLERLMLRIQSDFSYETRYAEGTQTPGETLKSGSGTCRDFAMLMIEAARVLGFGARFASGYLYSQNADSGEQNLGAAATHAWAEIYVPELGWTDYDPTNGIINGADLIKVAVARKPGQAIPVAGSYTGPATAAPDLTVNVDVHRLD